MSSKKPWGIFLSLKFFELIVAFLLGLWIWFQGNLIRTPPDCKNSISLCQSGGWEYLASAILTFFEICLIIGIVYTIIYWIDYNWKWAEKIKAKQIKELKENLSAEEIPVIIKEA